MEWLSEWVMIHHNYRSNMAGKENLPLWYNSITARHTLKGFHLIVFHLFTRSNVDNKNVDEMTTWRDGTKCKDKSSNMVVKGVAIGHVHTKFNQMSRITSMEASGFFFLENINFQTEPQKIQKTHLHPNLSKKIYIQGVPVKRKPKFTGTFLNN